MCLFGRFRENKIILKFTSKSFLQQQVRSMVGCIKYLGEGQWNLNDFNNYLTFHY